MDIPPVEALLLDRLVELAAGALLGVGIPRRTSGSLSKELAAGAVAADCAQAELASHKPSHKQAELMAIWFEARRNASMSLN